MNIPTPEKRHLYRQVLPRDPNKLYVDVKYLKIIGALMIVAVTLTAILSLISYAK